MTANSKSILRLAAVLTVMLSYLAGTAQAETLVGRNIDSRFMLAFSTGSEGIDALLPSGWTAVGFPSGPLKGANLLIGLEERHLALNAEGDPVDPARSRAAALMTLAKGEEGVRLYILRVLTTDAGYDLFPDAEYASAMRNSRFEGTDDTARQTETWRFESDVGGSLEITFDFEVGLGMWTSSDARPFSSSDPGISWVFRYDQLVDLVSSKAVGKPLSGNLAVSADLPGFETVLDGSETLMGILSIPVYIREVFHP